jgi:hypothetical protein
MFELLPKTHTKILLDLNAKFGRDDTLKLTIWNEHLHETSNDNGIKIVNFAHQKI